MKRNTYIALTTINPQQCGYHALAAGHDKKRVMQAALNNIRGTSELAEAYRINLRLVSKLGARQLGYDFDSPVNALQRLHDLEVYNKYTWVE